MKFQFTFWQALDSSSLFFIEKYIYHSQFTSKFFFGLHNSFLILNYNNTFFCIKRAFNFLESAILNRNNVVGVGEFYNFFYKSLKLFKYFNIFNLKTIPNGFLTNYKQYFTRNKPLKPNIKILKFLYHKKYDKNFITFQRKKKNWVGSKIKMVPPTVGIIFNTIKSFWVLNELKHAHLPIIALIYPKTELDSRVIQYPIPILHGADASFINGQADDFYSLKKYKNFYSIKEKQVKNKTIIGYALPKSENLIDIFFLFLFILISFYSYKKLILKFTQKSFLFLNNAVLNRAVTFNLMQGNRLYASKKFYHKSFLKFYIKLCTRVPLNVNLFFNNRNIKYVDRSLLWHPKKFKYIKKFIKLRGRRNRPLIFEHQLFTNIAKSWIQKKSLISFKGLNMLRRFKIKRTKMIPFIKTLIKRNVISAPTQRIALKRLQYWNYRRFWPNSYFKSKSDLFTFFYKVLRKQKRRLPRRRWRFLRNIERPASVYGYNYRSKVYRLNGLKSPVKYFYLKNNFRAKLIKPNYLQNLKKKKLMGINLNHLRFLH